MKKKKEKTNSPWNTPIFTIPKKSGKWRLLHDLREINKKNVFYGSLTTRLAFSYCSSLNWALIVIDLRDCFFTIPLAPQDKCRFAFSVSALNYKTLIK